MNVIRTDSDSYSCTVRNAFGTNSQSAVLIVKGLTFCYIFNRHIKHKLMFLLIFSCAQMGYRTYRYANNSCK
jgi:hypothetical protein